MSNLRDLRVLLSIALFSAASAASTGCYSLTIVNGKQPASAPIIEDKWRSAAAVDLVQIDTPIDFEATCKESGWAKVRQVYAPVDWFADLFLAGFWIYESTHVDVYCAKRGTQPAPLPGAPPAASPLPPSAPPTSAPPTPTQPPPLSPAPTDKTL